MSPVTHLLIGWSVANTFRISCRERALVTMAAIIPDFDGAGLIYDLFSHGPGQQASLWDTYHHILGHNISFGIFVCLLTCALSTRRWVVSLLAFLSFHCHLLGDLVGSRGPDGYQWPIPYLLPFSDAWQLVWRGQWQLTAWPNFAITVGAGFIMFYLAWQRGVSPLEIVSAKANDAFVSSLRNRFGQPPGEVCG